MESLPSGEYSLVGGSGAMADVERHATKSGQPHVEECGELESKRCRGKVGMSLSTDVCSRGEAEQNEEADEDA